ncbi:peptidoglycan-binding protein [Actinobacteria bacterium YIM 96077]|uniref:Peptidoglycan-binding protein n=1 Tax=Phytoactinopolyspora halophila TaxID=1981511 RepID=A0A329R148_9ACTN|nr:peptidoglycan-binding protein [Phytoactinopolyspora halophila]AYY11415.1 peptidoglycan-binding protein [Actinobacteria bacterium YIM 96077]RAW18103.1 peptidoglycan-binding protein [Phytoactinopolyspora halophila]
MHARTRTLLVVITVAVGALVAGVYAGTRITSPADAAAEAEPPQASEVTVPVESRTLESEVVTRGDASYTGAVDVELEFTGTESAPVVTGHVPEVGDEADAGDVLLEVIGRPVIALPGDLPMYRSLQPGMSGPDVEQLEEALQELGFDPGSVDETYTAATGRAVAALFEDAGYEPPAVDPEVQAELESAEEAVRQAEDEVANAEAALAEASSGPSKSEKISAQNDVDKAERALEQAREQGDDEAIADAQAQLDLAQARLEELLEGPDTSAEEDALENAKQRLAEAREERDAAAVAASTPLPSSEAAFVPTFPRRIDEVNVERGGTVDGPVMSISGADLVVNASVDATARELISKEDEAILELPTGENVTATITKIGESDDEESDEFRVVLTPDELTDEHVEVLRSANVRVTIPVESTDGEVLAVPLAALTTGPDEEARIEVQRPDAEDDEPATELVEVEVGLTTDGYAEVTPVDGELAENDLVIVGQENDAEADDTDDDG